MSHEEMVPSIHEPYLAWRSILSFYEEFKWDIDTFKASWSKKVGWQNLRPWKSHTITAECRPTEELLKEAQVDENSSDTSPEKPTTWNSILQKANKWPSCAKHCHNSVFLKTKMSFPEKGRKNGFIWVIERLGRNLKLWSEYYLKSYWDVEMSLRIESFYVLGDLVLGV